MKRINLLISLIATTILLFACGGGGGGGDVVEDSTPTDPNTVFDLTGFKSLNEGVTYEFYLEGSDSNGDDWEGFISASIGSNITIGSEVYIPEEIFVSLTHLPTNQTLTANTYGYYNLAEEPVFFISIDPDGDAMRCNATTIYSLPDFVLIGDTGELTQFYCNECTDSTCTSFNNYFWDLRGTWSIENANDGYAYFVTDVDQTDIQTGEAISERKKFKIDTSGTTLSLSVTDVFPNGYSRTLWSL